MKIIIHKIIIQIMAMAAFLYSLTVNYWFFFVGVILLGIAAVLK